MDIAADPYQTTVKLEGIISSRRFLFYEILFHGSSMVTKIIDGSIKRLTLAPEYLETIKCFQESMFTITEFFQLGSEILKLRSSATM